MFSPQIFKGKTIILHACVQMKLSIETGFDENPLKLVIGRKWINFIYFLTKIIEKMTFFLGANDLQGKVPMVLFIKQET